ncbi:hypothetical protein J1605_003495 [Eschrichtius robustus]|uniref:Uncharacterized protein n=1 Tax=Eschrichtius robustus TaxID=9764 RepID=A0AB34HT64_ESCRO|nr:hypothetical protein J1605_003495 [Eschrichtius robustus]
MADSLAGAAALSAPLTPSQPRPARSMRFACDSPGAAPQGLPGAFWSRGQLEELSFCMWRHRGLPSRCPGFPRSLAPLLPPRPHRCWPRRLPGDSSVPGGDSAGAESAAGPGFTGSWVPGSSALLRKKP